MTPSLLARIHQQHSALAQRLVADLGTARHWTGELSSSALSTATAVIALAIVDPAANTSRIQRGLEWLKTHSNPDGGWGDTVRSRSNLSTTVLVWAAFGITRTDAAYPSTIAAAVQYIERAAGSLDRLVPAIEALYGTDRTFSVPITMTLALCGRLGADGWKHVRALPFELAAFPRGLFGALRLPVVSYALPALIAIGQVIHHHHPRGALWRDHARVRTLRILEELQPRNGGFLEATPLTSFVTMSLGGMGLRTHPVARKGEAFLKASVRPDGSWPIDTNLSTWVSTLSIKALRHTPSVLDDSSRQRLRHWLLGQQYREIHPYTGAAPGGWAWTDLPGGVPDADDTAGALLALRSLGEPDNSVREAAALGCTWLMDLQNADGGIPTFCRGWGTLPFDQSTPELTAHALRAWRVWRTMLPPRVASRVERASTEAWEFLSMSQGDQGAWLPLWFGNEHTVDQSNPVYGTAQVLIAAHEDPACPLPRLQMQKAASFLVESQRPDGLWGGDAGAPASIEETSLALEALQGARRNPEAPKAVERGAEALCGELQRTIEPEPSPIGLYFARLWYFEKLYPSVFATSALGSLTSATH